MSCRQWGGRQMQRYALRDDQWTKIKDFLPGREGHVGGTAADNRLFVDAIIYRYRTGIPWRDLPERYGNWKATHKRLRRWCCRAGRVSSGPVRSRPSHDDHGVRRRLHSPKGVPFGLWYSLASRGWAAGRPSLVAARHDDRTRASCAQIRPARRRRAQRECG